MNNGAAISRAINELVAKAEETESLSAYWLIEDVADYVGCTRLEASGWFWLLVEDGLIDVSAEGW